MQLNSFNVSLRYNDLNNIVDINTHPNLLSARIYLHILNGHHRLKGSICKRLLGTVFLSNYQITHKSNFMNLSFSRTAMAIAILGSVTLSVGCTKSKDSDPLYIISGPASSLSDQLNTGAIGSISGVYNPITQKIAFNITWENLSSEAISSYFYKTSNTQPLDSMIVYLPIAQSGKKGVYASHLFLSENQAKTLLKQEWHFAICSAKHKNGELKGQITVVKP